MALALTATQIAQLQSLIPGIGKGTRQFYNIGGALYYVTKRQAPFPAADNLIVVFKSTDGVTWSLSASLFGSNNQGCSSIAFGTKIYIIDTKNGAAFNLRIYTYDTLLGTLTGPSSDGPAQNGAGQELQSITALNSGALAVASTTAGGNFTIQSYNPVGDAWSAATVLDALGSETVAQIADPVTGNIFLFYVKGGTNELHCYTLSSAFAVLNNSAAIFTFGASPFIGHFGLPYLTTDSPSGALSVAFPFWNAGTLRVTFVRVSSSAIVTETVEDGTTLPPGFLVQQYDQIEGPGWTCVDYGGVLYTLYTVDNGDLDNAASQCFLYVKARIGGVWTQQQVLFTSIIPNEMATPFASTFKNQPAILLNLFNPVTGVGVLGSLTSWILLGAAPGPPAPTVGGTNPGPAFTISPTTISYAILPDPRIICNVNGRKRCIVMKRSKTSVKVTTRGTSMER